jgi:hypothetical protein
LRRLERIGRRDLIDAILSRQVSSFAVACSLGWARRPATLKGADAHQRKRIRHVWQRLGREMPIPFPDQAPHELPHEQEMSLRYGDLPGHAAFASGDARGQAWLQHRERILSGYRGRRPQGWWDYESPVPFPGYDLERSTLVAYDLITEDEGLELVRQWESDFAQAQEPDFFSVKNGKVITGPEAKRRHYRWADIPSVLVREFRREYRRQCRSRPAA